MIECKQDSMEEGIRESDLLGHESSPGSAVEKAMLFLDNERESALYSDWLHASEVEKAIGGSNIAGGFRLTMEETPMLHDDIWVELDAHLQETGELAVPYIPNMGEAPTYSANESSASIRALQGALQPETSGLQPGGDAGHISRQTTLGKYKTWAMHSHSIDFNSESSSCERVGSTANNAEVYMKSPTGDQAEQPDPIWPQAQQVNKIRSRADKRCRVSVEERAVMDTGQEFTGVLMGETSEGVSSTSANDTFPLENSREPVQEPVSVAPGEEIVRYRATRSSRLRDPARTAMYHQNSFRLDRWDPMVAGRAETEALGKSIMLSTSLQLQDASKSGSQSRWAELLLNLCAASIASKNVARTQHLMWVLNDLGSFTGDANERLAAYGLKALFCRITGGKEAAVSYMKPLVIERFRRTPGASKVHRALVKFNDLTPWHTMAYTVCNATLLEAFAGRNRLHIVDIGVAEGIQWPTFIDALVSRAGGPPALLRITTIQDQRIAAGKGIVSTQHGEFMSRLVKFARLLGLNLEINSLLGPLECLTRQDFKLREGEVTS